MLLLPLVLVLPAAMHPGMCCIFAICFPNPSSRPPFCHCGICIYRLRDPKRNHCSDQFLRKNKNKTKKRNLQSLLFSIFSPEEKEPKASGIDDCQIRCRGVQLLQNGGCVPFVTPNNRRHYYFFQKRRTKKRKKSNSIKEKIKSCRHKKNCVNFWFPDRRAVFFFCLRSTGAVAKRARSIVVGRCSALSTCCDKLRIQRSTILRGW